MASGRLSVMVATPSVRSRSTGASDMPAVCQASRGSRATKRSAPGAEAVRLAREQLSGRRAGPVARQQLLGQARIGEQELPPFVHEVEARRERRLVVVPVFLELFGDQAARVGEPPVVLRPQVVEVPGLRRHRVYVDSPRGARGGARALEHRLQLAARERADPHVVGQLGVAQEAEVGAQPGPRAPDPRRLHHGEVPGARPTPGGGGRRSGHRPRRGDGWPARWCDSRGRCRGRPARASPASPSARSPCAPPGPRCRRAPAAARSRRPAPGCPGRADGRRTGRRGPTGRAWP